jgi:uncharacterized protein YqfA (UPF0365 family)
METLVAVFGLVFLLVMLSMALVFGRYLRLWMQCTLSGTPIPLTQIVAMTLRKTPARRICESAIKLNQSGLGVTATDLERAYLQGADVEKLTETMLHARSTGRDVTWEELVQTELASP